MFWTKTFQDQTKLMSEMISLKSLFHQPKSLFCLVFWIAPKVFMPLQLLSMTRTCWWCSRFRSVAFRSVITNPQHLSLKVSQLRLLNWAQIRQNHKCDISSDTWVKCWCELFTVSLALTWRCWLSSRIHACETVDTDLLCPGDHISHD